MVLNQFGKENFYKKLSEFLKHRNYGQFLDLINQAPILDIHLDPKLISDRFKYISDNVLDCLKKVGEFYQTSSLGDIIDILRFANQFNLFERDLSLKEQSIINKVAKDEIFISNLKDLFGKITNCFILFVRVELPKILYKYLSDFPSSYFENKDLLIYYVKNVFWDQYTIYGLNVKKIGSFKDFFDSFKQKNGQSTKRFIEFDIGYNYSDLYRNSNEIRRVKRHLVSPNIVLKIAPKVLNESNYRFFSLSMVLLGGIGPQGHGFTYATPRKEIVEICSDIKENDAIIIKYKLFLKTQFLNQLRKELLLLSKQLREIILKFLDSTLNQNELIGYDKRDKLIKKIAKFLENLTDTLKIEKINLGDLIDIISEKLSIMLRPINMIDQFKCRMNLMNEGKLNSDDMAKLTSLKGKSHYDVLKERLFFQYITDWFYDLYLEDDSN